MRVEVDEVSMAVAPRSGEGQRAHTPSQSGEPELELAALRRLQQQLEARERRLRAT